VVELVRELSDTAQKVSQQHSHGTVVNLQLCVKHMEPMKQVRKVRALENRGLEGDRHAMPDSSRQVLLFEQETCLEYDFPIGALRENITTRGINLMTLPGGTRLQIGDAILETTKACEPCSFVDSIKPGLRGELATRRGMLARVVRGGEISAGSKIIVLDK
jgi:MOSC domain-containing protein YiiM